MILKENLADSKILAFADYRGQSPNFAFLGEGSATDSARKKTGSVVFEMPRADAKRSVGQKRGGVTLDQCADRASIT
jgi:hypothetical protein